MQQQTYTKESLEAMLEAVDELQLRGLHKIWVYNFAVACRLSWPLLVYDFPHTFVEDLQRIANAYVKKWVGMARFGTNPIILYMPKKDKGLGVINLEHFYENLGIVREHLLKYSGDPVIVRLAARRLARATADRHRKWYAPMALVAERGLALDAMTAAGQATRADICFGLQRRGQMPAAGTKAHRERVTAWHKERLVEEQRRQLGELQMQADWVQWKGVMSRDLSCIGCGGPR